LPPYRADSRFQIDLNEKGYAPYIGRWTEENLPPELVIKLPSTRSIGGVIKDSQGKPIEGVQVELTVPNNVSRLTPSLPESPIGHWSAKATTDAAGRWVMHEIPVDQIEYEKFAQPAIQGIQPRRVFLSHPAYRVTPVEIELRQLLPGGGGRFEHVFTMEKLH
jgi:hypothetical protein